MRNLDFMIRCPAGHFIKDARKVGAAFVFSPMGMADGFCKRCDDYVPVDGREQMDRLYAAFKALGGDA